MQIYEFFLRMQLFEEKVYSAHAKFLVFLYHATFIQLHNQQYQHLP